MKGYKKKKKKIIFSSHWSTDSRMYSAGDETVGVWWHILTGIPLCACNVMPPKGEIKKKKKFVICKSISKSYRSVMWNSGWDSWEKSPWKMRTHLGESLDLLLHTGRLSWFSTFPCCLLLASNFGASERFMTKGYPTSSKLVLVCNLRDFWNPLVFVL